MDMHCSAATLLWEHKNDNMVNWKILTSSLISIILHISLMIKLNTSGTGATYTAIDAIPVVKRCDVMAVLSPAS